MANSAKKRQLKEKLFKRDGWQDSDGYWYANCEFGCGEILIFKTATLDRYPIMGKRGGRYEMNNLRLACQPCNSVNQNKHEWAKKKKHRGKSKAERLAWYLKTHEEARQRQIENAREQRIRGEIVESKKEFVCFASPQYSNELKRKLAENYPKSEGRDKNGVLIDVVCPDHDTP